MAEAGTPFKGVLYAGLMIDEAAPKLIEYNVRFGDPECQVLMLRLKSDLLPALLAVARAGSTVSTRWHDEPALCVVMAAKGYPGAYAKGTRSRASMLRRAILTCRSSMPAPSATATASSPMAGACSASRRTAATFARRRQGLRGGRQDRLAWRLLPPRHRLARGGPVFSGESGHPGHLLPFAGGT